MLKNTMTSVNKLTSILQIAAFSVFICLMTLVVSIPSLFVMLDDIQVEMEEGLKEAQTLGREIWSEVKSMHPRNKRSYEPYDQGADDYENVQPPSLPYDLPKYGYGYRKIKCCCSIEGYQTTEFPISYKCPVGPKGAKGVKGETGEQGSPGRPGYDGEDYYPIPLPPPLRIPSESPALCPPCPPGPPGPCGPPGPMGYPGRKGARGVAGTPGCPGKQGEYGEDGNFGKRGRIGLPGLKGSPGADGIGGARGLPGVKGECGSPGVAGPRGIGGSPGDFGPPGSMGELGGVGSRGPPGLDGLEGAPGREGRPGDDGGYCNCPPKSKEDHSSTSSDVYGTTSYMRETTDESPTSGGYSSTRESYSPAPSSSQHYNIEPPPAEAYKSPKLSNQGVTRSRDNLRAVLVQQMRLRSLREKMARQREWSQESYGVPSETKISSYYSSE